MPKPYLKMVGEPKAKKVKDTSGLEALIKNKAESLIRKTVPDEIDRILLLQFDKQPPASIRQAASVIGRSHATAHTRILWLAEHGYLRVAEGLPPGSGHKYVLGTLGFQYLHPETYGEVGTPFRPVER